MSKVGTREFMESKGVLAYATVPREVVLRAMAEDQCLDSRLRHAMILWSWCGPEPSEAVVRKDQRGFIARDGDGNPLPARFKDLMALLGIPPGKKAWVSRTAKCLIDQNLLRIEDKTMYLIFKPSLPKKSKAVARTDNWNIGGLVVRTGNLPDDPVARTRALEILEAASTRWKNDLRDAKTRNRLLTVRELSEVGILIEKRKKRLREEKGASSSSGFPAVEEATTTIPPSSPPEPEEPEPPAGPRSEDWLRKLGAQDEIREEAFEALDSGSSAGTAVALAVAPVEPAAVAEALVEAGIRPDDQAVAPVEPAAVAEALVEAGIRPDDQAVGILITRCRDNVRDCTTAEVVAFIREKAPIATRKVNPMGYLLTTVPNCFAGGSFQAMRGRDAPVPPKKDGPLVRLMKQRIARGEAPW